jgi:hypothetical protein
VKRKLHLTRTKNVFEKNVRTYKTIQAEILKRWKAFWLDAIIKMIEACIALADLLY